MIYLKKFNEGGEIRCEYCDGEGREPSCPMCGKVYDYSDEDGYEGEYDYDSDEEKSIIPEKEGFYEALERYHDEEHVDSSNHVALDNFVSWLQKNYENSVKRKI